MDVLTEQEKYARKRVIVNEDNANSGKKWKAHRGYKMSLEQFIEYITKQRSNDHDK